MRLPSLRNFARIASPTVTAFRNFASATENAASDAATRLPVMSTAVLVERLPVVIPKPPEWFISYEQFSFERSQRHRKVYPAEFLAAAAEPPSDDTKRVLAEGEVDIQTTTDFSTFYDDPSRRTEADATSNTKSTQRALDRRLYLIIKSKSNTKAPANVPVEMKQDLEQERWRLPEALYAQEDSLRQCAEGVISQVITNNPEEIYFVGNAPFAHLEENPENVEDQQCKRFFFWAHWIGQEASLAEGSVKDYAWVTKEELLDHLSGTKEYGILHQLLLE